jgi:DNA-binding transcriptional LysR family regulator
MSISLRQIEAFVAVCTEGSFSKAALRIHISQSGLSVLIRDLEENLDARLFDRSTRQVMLTDAGREFRAPAARLLADLSSAVGNVRGLAMRQHGSVAVAAPPLLMAKLLVGVAATFRVRYPDIALKLLDIPSEDILPAIHDAQVDLGVGSFPEESSDYTFEPLLEGPLMVLLPRAHAAAEQRTLTWKELVQYPLVMQTPENNFRGFLDRTFASQGLQPRIAIEVAQLSTVISLVEAGFGIALLPRYTVLFPTGRKTVVRPVSEPAVQSRIVIARDRFRSSSAAAVAFMETMREAVAGVPRT